MKFEPMGGFPPITTDDDGKTDQKTIDARGLAASSIVSISNIMKKKQQTNSLILFGPEDEDGFGTSNVVLDDMLFAKPHEYNKILFENSNSDSGSEAETKPKSKPKPKSKSKSKSKAKPKTKSKTKSKTNKK